MSLFVRCLEGISPARAGQRGAGPSLALNSEALRPADTFKSIKRLVDVSLALFLLAAALPLMFVLGLLIRLSSPGPVIYRQLRLTEGGRVFTMYKFRTMRLDAEKQSGPVTAIPGDPRVTRLGRIMRQMRLDELPQLLNVIIGDMSIVGPRPERPEIAKILSRELPLISRRLEVPAGLTGLAQVRSGYASNVEGYQEKLRWDLDYIEQRSLHMDFKILLETIRVVCTGFGSR